MPCAALARHCAPTSTLSDNQHKHPHTRNKKKIYLNDGDTQEDFIVTGNLRGKKFDIVATRGNVPLAHVAKESRFASAGAFLRQQLTAIDKYFVTVNPGVDGAGLCCVLRAVLCAVRCALRALSVCGKSCWPPLAAGGAGASPPPRATHRNLPHPFSSLLLIIIITANNKQQPRLSSRSRRSSTSFSTTSAAATGCSDCTIDEGAVKEFECADNSQQSPTIDEGGGEERRWRAPARGGRCCNVIICSVLLLLLLEFAARDADLILQPPRGTAAQEQKAPLRHISTTIISAHRSRGEGAAKKQRKQRESY